MPPRSTAGRNWRPAAGRSAFGGTEAPVGLSRKRVAVPTSWSSASLSPQPPGLLAEKRVGNSNGTGRQTGRPAVHCHALGLSRVKLWVNNHVSLFPARTGARYRHRSHCHGVVAGPHDSDETTLPVRIGRRSLEDSPAVSGVLGELLGR